MSKTKFTLIEMVVVCAILLFLTAGLFALGNSLFKKYYIMSGKMEMLKIQNGLAAYKSATGTFPPDYMSSSHNENASGGGAGAWVPTEYIDITEFNLAVNFYDTIGKPAGAPKALVRYTNAGHTRWGIWTWSWRGDIGGEVPFDIEPNVRAGFVCQEKEKASISDFTNTPMPNKGTFPHPTTGIIEVLVEKYDVENVHKCKFGQKGSQPKPFDCNAFDPNDPKITCGWHSFSSEIWEGSYDRAESGKAIYDYLGRPMKGRVKEGVPVNIKFENAKPFVEFSNKIIKATGKPPSIQCNGELLDDNPNNYKRFGSGLYNVTDSFEVIDVWGESYLYVSSTPEYTTPSFNYTVRPYQSYWVADSALGVNDSFTINLYKPFYNPSSYDLGSKGPDRKVVNWIPRDFKLASQSGYEKMDDNDVYISTIFGQTDGAGIKRGYYTLPSEELKKIDYDNDNITNFSDNDN